MKKIIVLLAILTASASHAQQSAKVTKKFFPDPQIEVNTPAFSGGAAKRLTSYKQMMQYLNGLVAQQPQLFSMEYIGETQRGKQIPVIRIANGSGDDKLKVMFSARVHGDEPGSTEGMLYLLERFSKDASLQRLLTKLDVAVIPMVNIDGGKFLNRAAANGSDLNRDMSKLANPESVALRAFFNKYAPEVSIDFHEYQPLRNDYWNLAKDSYNMSTPFDAMFLYSTNLNVAPQIREITQKLFVANAKQAYDKKGYTHHDYYSSSMGDKGVVVNVGGASARSTANAFALSNSISVLMEIRGVRLGTTTLKRRVEAAFLAAESYLQTTYENADSVRAAIRGAINSKHDVVVTQRSKKVDDYTLPFIDLERAAIVEVPVKASIVGKSKPKLVRTRPLAYYLDASASAAVSKLRQLGVEVEELRQPSTLNVEGYRVASAKETPNGTDGVKTVNAKTTVEAMSITLPVGSYLVSMDQRMATMASSMLEPEAANGFVFFRIIEAKRGDMLPVYRLVK